MISPGAIHSIASEPEPGVEEPHQLPDQTTARRKQRFKLSLLVSHEGPISMLVATILIHIHIRCHTFIPLFLMENPFTATKNLYRDLRFATFLIASIIAR